MRLDTSLHQRLSQEMKLAPRIIQAMEILQLPMMALQERIDAELQSNPVLEMQEQSDGSDMTTDVGPDREWGESQMVVDDDHGNREDFSRLNDMTNEYGDDFANPDAPAANHSYTGDGDSKLEAMANAPAAEESLTEYLLQQWVFLDVAPELFDAGKAIIAYIEDDGYLRTPLEAIASRTDEEDETPLIPLDALRRALPLVQSLDPTGVGARDLRECLLLQLDAEAAAGRDVTLQRELVSNFLREIEMNRLPAIAKRTSRNLDDIKDAITSISRLNPYPGRLIRSEAAPVIRPEVIVTIDENDQVIVRMADGHLPALMINDYYSEQARNRGMDKNTRQFLQRNIRSAQWLIEAISQRRHTIRRVTEEVFKVQREFLDVGPEALKPLPMADVAEKVGVHVATVSRAVSDKYAQTPRGIFPLRMFFSGGTKTADGEDMSWDAVKIKLQEIVDKEDKSKPLNDDKLVEALKADGIDIARRTVAKYRGILDIPPARQRREY